MNKELKISNYPDFYLYYLTQHMHPTCRMLHAIGLSLGIACFIGIFVTGKWWLLLVGLAIGYGFAWTGHFFLEKNKPAAFSKPLWSFISDWVMYKDILTGQINAKLQLAKNQYGDFISDEALKAMK